MNSHSIEDRLELITKWDDKERHIPIKLINSKTRRGDEDEIPTFNAITYGGDQIGANNNNLDFMKI